MPIQVRYFAQLKSDLGKATEQLNSNNIQTVSQVWQLANPNIALPKNTLAAVNLNYVDLEFKVVDQDEVAFFPPVTGG